MRRSTIAFVVLAVITGSLAAISPITLRTGHEGAVVTLVADETSGTVVSGGADGRVIVWSDDGQQVLRTIRASQMPVRSVVMYPDGERIAVYTGDGRTHHVSVWNWRSGERQFLHTAETEILWMDVSAAGSYLIYTTPRLRSVVVLDGESGRTLPFLRESTGIVTWAVISGSEERLMIYVPTTGEIVYHSIVTGRVDARFRTEAGLESLSLLPSRRYAAARNRDGRLAIIDLLAGATVAEAPAGDIIDTHIDPQTGELIVIARVFDDRSSLRRYVFEDGRLRQRFGTRRDIDSDVSVLLNRADVLIGGTSAGDILSWPPFAPQPTRWDTATLERVVDLAVAGDRVHLLTPDRVISLSSDFLGADRDRAVQADYVRQRVAPLPGDAERLFANVSGGQPVIWTPSPVGGRQVIGFSFVTGTERAVNLPTVSGLQDLDANDASLLVLSRTGEVQLQDRVTGAVTFSYRALGLQSAILTSRGIIVTKARQGTLDSAVLRLNPDTGETVPIESESVLAFTAAFDERRGRLYVAGIRRNAAGTSSTVIELFEGTAFQRRRTILEVPGEYLEAQIAIDLVTGTMFTTLDDRGGVLRWTGARMTGLTRNPSHMPKRIVVEGQTLFTVNHDGSVSIADSRTGNLLMDLYVLDDGLGSWLAVSPGGSYVTSRASIATRATLSLNATSGTLASRRLPLPMLPYGVGTAPPETTNPDSRFDVGTDPDDPDRDRALEYDPTSGDPAPSS